MSTMSYEELMKITNYYLTNRKGWKVLNWNVGPGEKNIVRYTDINDCAHTAHVIHLFAEMREDETFGVFEQTIEAVIKTSRHAFSELLIVFRRPFSKIVFIYVMGSAMMNETCETWTNGKQGQFQISIKHFTKEDEFEYDFRN